MDRRAIATIFLSCAFQYTMYIMHSNIHSNKLRITIHFFIFHYTHQKTGQFVWLCTIYTNIYIIQLFCAMGPGCRAWLIPFDRWSHQARAGHLLLLQRYRDPAALCTLANGHAVHFQGSIVHCALSSVHFKLCQCALVCTSSMLHILPSLNRPQDIGYKHLRVCNP